MFPSSHCPTLLAVFLDLFILGIHWETCRGTISCSEPLLWQLSLSGGWDWVKNISKCMWYICASQEQRQKPSCDMVLLVWFVYSHSNHGLFPDPCSTSQWNPTVGTPLMVYTTHSRKKCRSFIKVEAFLHTIIQP